MKVCNVSPYAAMLAMRTEPWSPVRSWGSATLRAPRSTAAAWARSVSGTERAIVRTPSPWTAWWRAISVSERSAPVSTKRMRPCSRTCETRSRRPVSRPAKATGRKPKALA